MDYQFPQQLFPLFYNCEPPSRVQRHSAGGWGCYDGVLAQGGSGSLSSWAFTSKRQVEGEVWRQTEPVPVPLFTPRKAFQEHVAPPDPMDFLKHMQNFFMDHGPDAFGCMSDMLGENFDFQKAKNKKKCRPDSVNMCRKKRYIEQLKFNMCPRTYRSTFLDRYASLLWDVVHDVPPELLGSLLYEELTEQRDRMQFSEVATGGALAFVPFSQSDGCLLYPGGLGMDRLNFHRVALQRDGGACVDGGRQKPVSFQLTAPVRQISCGSLFGDSCVAVRCDHVCGVWGMAEQKEPRLLQVVSTDAAASCVSVSPHILGEVLVASESGAADLWTVGRGMQKVRTEESNLYFNAKSSWRWCEFSAHPRVMLYADRTGAELTDFRLKLESNLGHTLFRISSTSDCQSGERLLLVRYLGDAHPFHHLVATQHSAYIMDERFPCVPMLKWDHMMEAPPLFCHVAPGSSGTTKVLLGSQSSQEIMLLQYSGGAVEACCSHGSPQVLLRPRDSLALLPVQIPHRQQTAAHRLASPAAGLTCLQTTSVSMATMIVLQLTAAGDVFYQILERDDRKPGAPETTGGAPASAVPPDTGAPQEVSGALEASRACSPLLVAESLSDEDIVMATQPPNAPTLVPETPDADQSSDRPPDQIPPLVAVGNAAVRSAPSSATLHTWRRWLQQLTRQERKPGALPHFAVQSAGLLSVPEPDATARHLQGALPQDLQRCMRTRSLLLKCDLDVVPVPAAVDAEAWPDSLSNRLTAAWRGGKEAWLEWWQEHRGANRAMRKEALRRKRRREKEAQRAAGRHLQLSSSFTSSISYQRDLDDFSGWSSGTSGPLSDSQWSRPLGRLATDLENQCDSPPDCLDPPTTPSRTPGTLTANQRSRNLADQSLSSVWETQDDPPLPPSSSSSRLPSFRTLTPSRASQSQRGALQASQPKKKKSRMGF